MTSSKHGPEPTPLTLRHQLIEELTVRPGAQADLAHRSTSDTNTDWLGPTSPSSTRRDVAARDLDDSKAELAAAQELLYSSNTWALLVILQAPDAGGKDGTIKHVLSGLNPQGCDVVSFKEPSSEELSHDFLWRCARALPARGRIGIFNRSYYEEVLIVRVHPELLIPEHLPEIAEPHLWQQRYDDINRFEHHLHRSGTRIVKLFLHVSKEEQKRRFLERLDDPTKQWKLASSDIAERAYFDDYQHAYEEALTATSTAWAPWYVVPADRKYAMRALVGRVLTHVIGSLDLRPPEVSQERLEALAAAKQSLLAEGT
jgi:PPK2 family polyphosphate:nucleotide phosphotransferase